MSRPIGLLLDDEAVLEVIASPSATGGIAARTALRTAVANGVTFVVLGHRGDSTGRLVEPSVSAGELARLETSLGVVIAADPDRDHPYNLARRVLSVDSLTGGRAGLLLDPAQSRTQYASATTWAGDTSRDDVVEYADLVTTLWGTFARVALVGDQASGLFARSELLRRAAHDGRWKVGGGLGTPSSVQGLPPVLWWGTDAPEEADAVIVGHRSTAPARPEYLLTDVATVTRAALHDGVVIRVRGGGWPAVAAALRNAVGTTPDPGAAPLTLRNALGLPPRTADVSGLPRAFPVAPSVPARKDTSTAQGARA
ncbi:MAG: hypothetical protein JWP75_3061 [Frondihabitans sp.]|nr:hypothetical protein [Frondihabitans sp.]